MWAFWHIPAVIFSTGYFDFYGRDLLSLGLWFILFYAFGLTYSFLRGKTGSLWFPIVLHAFENIAAATVVMKNQNGVNFTILAIFILLILVFRMWKKPEKLEK